MKKMAVVFMLLFIACTVFAGGKSGAAADDKVVFGYVAYQLIDV